MMEGKNIKILIDNLTVTGVNNNTLNVNLDMFNKKTLNNSKWLEFYPNRKNWNIPVNIIFDQVESGNININTVYSYFANGTRAVVYFGDVTFVNQYWGGYAIITNVSITAPNNNRIDVNFTLKGTGRLYENTQLASAAWTTVIAETYGASSWDNYTGYKILKTPWNINLSASISTNPATGLCYSDSTNGVLSDIYTSYGSWTIFDGVFAKRITQTIPVTTNVLHRISFTLYDSPDLLTYQDPGILIDWGGGNGQLTKTYQGAQTVTNFQFTPTSPILSIRPNVELFGEYSSLPSPINYILSYDTLTIEKYTGT